MRVLIADDHKLVREIVAAHLEQNGNFDVSLADSVDMVLNTIANSGSFEVILLDLAMPGMFGLQGVEKVVAANAPNATVIFSGTTRRDTIKDAIRLGARGFIPKTLPSRSLVNAVQFIALGEIFLPAAFFNEQLDEPNEYSRAVELTPIERTVLRSLCLGATNKEIAREHDLTEVTVKMHLRSVCNKLGAKNRTHAAMLAREAGIA